MSVESHIEQLNRRHAALEKQLNDAMNHPSTDDFTIQDIKRKKLQIKDEIARLQN